MSAIFDEDRQHIDPLTDALLVGGKIYVGTAGLDPIVNPINVYDNRLFTGSPLAQPVIIDVNGRATSKMWVSGKYSLQIDSSADVQQYQQLQNGFDESVGNIQTTGSLGVDDITATGVPVQTAYTDNKAYIVTAPADNTGAMTINIDGLGVIDIKKAHDQAITSGDVKADMKLQLIYNATDGWMELQSAVLGSVFAGGITVTDATDSTSGATGSIQTDGGVGIVKDLFVGGDILGGAGVLGSQTLTTSGTEHDYTAFPSWVRKITIMFNGVSTNGTDRIMIQIGDSGGLETSGYTASVWDTDAVGSGASAGFYVTGATAATGLFYGHATLTLMDAASFLWMQSGVLADRINGASSISGGSRQVASVLTQIRITTSGGTDTFDNGAINVLYE